MSQDTLGKLNNSMAYGTVTRGQLPGDIQDYNVTLIKQYHKNSPPTLKLKFTLAKKQQKYQSNFYVKIDNIVDPAHPMLLMRYSQEQGKSKAKALNKIKYKMALSVQKQVKIRQEVVEENEQQSDSDIPKGKPIWQYLGRLDEEKPRKRGKNNESDEDQQSV